MPITATNTVCLLVIIGLVSAHENHGDHFKGQVLTHRGANAVEGEKHIDTHDKEQGAEHLAKSLDHKGTDKSNTNTQAQLTATMNAKDQHSDSYSHLHDNAHETEAMDDNDNVRGDETMIGFEHGMFSEIGAPGPHGDLPGTEHDREMFHGDFPGTEHRREMFESPHGEFDGPMPMHLHPSEYEWDAIDHDVGRPHGDHHEHEHDDPFHEFGHGGRLDGDMYTGPDYDMFGGNHHMVHGGGLDHHGHHDLRHGPMDMDEVPWVAADHF